MSEETTEQQELTDKELNFEKLRQKNEELEAQIQSLAPLKVAQTIRDAGFDPDSPDGKALSRLVDQTADVDKVKEVAADIGFEPPEPKAELSETEQAVQAGADKVAALNQVTSSDGPPDDAAEIQELEAEGKWADAGRKKLQRFLAAQQ